MFEKIKINENSKEISDKVNELYELVANDPQYVEFTNSGESFESLAEYVSSDADLSKMVQTMKNALSTINPRVFRSYGTLNLHKSIVCINKLNGYPSKENPLIVLPNSVIEETTEKKPGTSMTEMVYAYLDNKGYGGIRNDKMDRMLLHLAHLSESMMSKLSEIELIVKKEQLKEKTADVMDDEKERQFFNEYTDAAKLHLVLADDEEFRRNDNSLQQKVDAINKEIDTLNSSQKARDEKLKELLEDPSYLSFLQKALKDIEQEQKNKTEAELKAYEENQYATLRGKNEDNKIINKEIEAENRSSEEFNKKLDEQIEAVNRSREEKLSTYRKQEEEANRIRAEREENYRKLASDFYNKQNTLPDRVDLLYSQIANIQNLSKASQYISTPEFKPSPAHFRVIDAQNAKIDSINVVADKMFALSGNTRYAPQACEMLTPESIKKVSGLRNKLEEANKKLDQLTAQYENRKDDKGLDKLKANLDAARKAQRIAEENFAPHKGASDLQDLYKKLMENKELKKEFDANKKADKSLSIYQNLSKMARDAANIINEMRMEPHNRDYYEALTTYQTLSARTDIPKEEQYKDILAEYTKAKKELDSLKLPGKEEYDKETRTLCARVFNKKEAEAAIAEINAAADKEIKGLNDQRIELENLREVLTDEQIEKIVKENTAKEAQLMGNSYLVYTNVAKKQYVQDKADDIIRDYISKRTDEKYRISETRSSLELDRRHAKEYFEKAQQNFKNLPDTKAEMAAFKTGGTSFSTVLLNQLQRELQSIDKGRTPGHEDTAEFTAMKDFLQETCDYVTYTKELLDQKDPAAFEGLRQKLTDMKTKSSEYYDKKMEHDKWHLKPSKMRFVRLEAAKRLQRVADFNIENADNILKVCADAAELQEKTANIQIEDPGTNFKEFVLNHVPEATKNKVIAIDQQRAADKLQSSRKNEERERIVI